MQVTIAPVSNSSAHLTLFCRVTPIRGFVEAAVLLTIFDMTVNRDMMAVNKVVLCGTVDGETAGAALFLFTSLKICAEWVRLRVPSSSRLK